jgi:hypothetical protein
MALPFIAGIAFGGLAVIAFNNKDKIKANLEIKFKDGIKKGKELAKEAKEYADKKIDEFKDNATKKHKIKSNEVATQKSQNNGNKKAAKRSTVAKIQKTPVKQTNQE